MTKTNTDSVTKETAMTQTSKKENDMQTSIALNQQKTHLGRIRKVLKSDAGLSFKMTEKNDKPVLLVKFDDAAVVTLASTYRPDETHGRKLQLTMQYKDDSIIMTVSAKSVPKLMADFMRHVDQKETVMPMPKTEPQRARDPKPVKKETAMTSNARPVNKTDQKWTWTLGNLRKHYPHKDRRTPSFLERYNVMVVPNDTCLIAQIEDADGRLGELQLWLEDDKYHVMLSHNAEMESSKTVLDCTPQELPSALKTWLNSEELEDMVTMHTTDVKLKHVSATLKESGFLGKDLKSYQLGESVIIAYVPVEDTKLVLSITSKDGDVKFELKTEGHDVLNSFTQRKMKSESADYYAVRFMRSCASRDLL